VYGHYQPHFGALKDAAGGSFNDYVALAADLFADYALSNGAEGCSRLAATIRRAR